MLTDKFYVMHSVQRYGKMLLLHVATSFPRAANFKQKMLT
jgi:hypothetical protein